MTPKHLKNILKSIYIITLTLMCSWSINAQTTDSTRVLIEDNWIEKMNSKIAFDISFNNSYETFEVKTPGNKFILYPNTPTNLRFNLNYRFISFGFQMTPDFLPGNGDEDTKGKTKSFELGTELIFKHWFTSLSYSKVKGYYLENSNDFITINGGDPYIQFPDLHYNGLDVSIGYIINSKFSLRSLKSQTERQLKSAGSFIPEINFRYYNLNDKSASPSTQKSKNIEASIGPGYAYTFVAKEKFYLSLGLSADLGYLNTRLTTRQSSGNINTTNDNFIFRWEGKTGIGYNGRSFYTGLFANVSDAQYKQGNTTATNFETNVYYHFFIGLRIEAPDFLKRLVDKAENKIPKL